MPIFTMNYNNNKLKFICSTAKMPTIKGKSYYPLAVALFENTTKEQRDKIINKNNIIIYQDLLNCFSYRAGLGAYDTECICKEKISNVYCVENIITLEPLEIGCKCIQNWTDREGVKASMKKDELEHKNKKNGINEEVKLCPFCSKNIKNKKCKMCAPKELCLSVFTEWKNHVLKLKSIKQKVINKWKLLTNYKNKLAQKVITQWKNYVSNRQEIEDDITEDTNPENNIIYLYVPFDDRNKIKNQGAYWDTGIKKWYAYNLTTRLKQYKEIIINVPFKYKEFPKLAGCKWTTDGGKWYCNENILNANPNFRNFILK
jgi:hypothetical protein